MTTSNLSIQDLIDRYGPDQVRRVRDGHEARLASVSPAALPGGRSLVAWPDGTFAIVDGEPDARQLEIAYREGLLVRILIDAHRQASAAGVAFIGDRPPVQ